MTDAEKRVKLVERLNSSLVRVQDARNRVTETKERLDKAVNDARSQVGTAQAELDKAEAEAMQIRKQLLECVPCFRENQRDDTRSS